MKTTEYVYRGMTARTLADGRPMGFGDTATLTAEAVDDPYNKGLIDAGLLVRRTAKPKADAAQAEGAGE